MNDAFAVLLFVVALSPFAPALAHEGHDHGDSARVATPPATDGLPRIVAVSDLFEAVGVFGDGALTLYIDGFSDNQPVTGARVDVESDSLRLKSSATEVAPAIYRVALRDPPPGQHALTIAVTTGDAADLLLARLDVGKAAAPAMGATESGPGRAVALATAVAVAALVGIAWMRRRRSMR